MCGIFCFRSVKEYSQDELLEVKDSLHHRGPDHSTITSVHLNNNSKLHFIVTQLVIVGNEPFPIESEFSIKSNSIITSNLIGNIEIYNYKELYNLYFQNQFTWNDLFSDAHIILPLFNKLHHVSKSLQQTASKLFTLLEGDFAFITVISNRYLLIARDQVGIRPLYYIYKDNFDFAFSSEVQSLLLLKYKFDEIKTVVPGTYSIIDLEDSTQSMTWSTMANNLSTICQKRYSRTSKDIFLPNQVLESLFEKLVAAVTKRVPDNKFALFLSGGIDSSVLLGLLRYLKVDANLKIISVGFENSSDLINARKICKSLNMSLYEVIITKRDIKEALSTVVTILRSRTGTISVLDVSIALPLFFLSKKANELGCKVAMSGQGADEIFIGYKKYYELGLVENRENLLTKVNNDLIHIAQQNLERDDLISMHHSLEIRFPFLDMALLTWLLDVPIDYLYSGNEQFRKELLRKVAAKMDLPNFIIERQKKAAQYGTSIMKNLHQLAKEHKSIKTYLESII